MISEILGLFVNTLTADDKYSIHNSETLWQPIQIQLPKKQQTCAQFLSFFLKSTLIFQHFEKKMTLIVYVFSELRPAKDVVR